MRLLNTALLLSLLIICSCTIQKRHYTSGYYVSWSTNKKQTPHHGETKEPGVTKSDSKIFNKTEAPAVLDASGSKSLNSNDLKTNRALFFPPEDSCDVLIFKDGSEVKVKVTEIGLNDVKYKRCNNLEGPNHISRKSEIFMIKYANGTKEVVRSESPEPAKTYDAQQRTPTKTYAYNTTRRKLHPLAIPGFAIGIANYFIGFYCLIFALSAIFPYAILLIPILLGIAAIVLCKIALSDMKEHPETWKGRGFAIPGLIAGFIVAGIGLLFLFLFTMLA